MNHPALTTVYRNRLVTIVSFLLIFSILLTPVSARAGIEEKLPADTLVYAHWAGRSLTFDGSQFGQMLQQDAMMDILKVAFKKGFGETVGTKGRPAKTADVAEVITKLIDITWQRPITVALAGLSNKTGVRRADLFIELGKYKPEFEKALNELLASMFEKDKLPPSVPLGNGSYTLIEMGENQVALGFSENLFFITFGQAKAQAEALLTEKTGPGLDTNKKFVASMKDVGGPDVQAAIYIDVESVLTQAEGMFPAWSAPTSQPAGAPKTAVSMMKKITTSLGVERLTVMAGTIRIVDKGMLSKLKIFSPAPHRGILMPFAGEPLSQADLSAIPADADFAMAINLDPTILLAEIRKIVDDINPKASAIIDVTLGMVGQLSVSSGISSPSRSCRGSCSSSCNRSVSTSSTSSLVSTVSASVSKSSITSVSSLLSGGFSSVLQP